MVVRLDNMFSVEDFAESFKTLSNDELNNMLTALMQVRSERERTELDKDAKYSGYTDTNNQWKVPLNLKSFEDMGRLDLLKRETDRQKRIKAADKECFKQHGRYVTQKEFESGIFNVKK